MQPLYSKSIAQSKKIKEIQSSALVELTLLQAQVESSRGWVLARLSAEAAIHDEVSAARLGDIIFSRSMPNQQNHSAGAAHFNRGAGALEECDDH
jgi:hypothetical protein